MTFTVLASLKGDRALVLEAGRGGGRWLVARSRGYVYADALAGKCCQ